VDLIKMDVEGAEVDIFESATDEELRAVRQFTVEFHGRIYPELVTRVGAIKTRMRRLGFWCINFSHLSDTDAVFLNRSVLGVSTSQYLSLKYIKKWTVGVRRRFSRLR
jgi:hypothetical protein